MKFSDIIRHAMKTTGITQTQLGDLLGVRQTAISNTVLRPGINLSKFVTVMNALGYDVIVRRRDDPDNEIIVTNEEPQSPLD